MYFHFLMVFLIFSVAYFIIRKQYVIYIYNMQNMCWSTFYGIDKALGQQ